MSLEEIQSAIQDKKSAISKLNDKLEHVKEELSDLKHQFRKLSKSKNVELLKQRIYSGEKIAIVFVCENSNGKLFDEMLAQCEDEDVLVDVTRPELIEGRYTFDQVYNINPEREIEGVRHTEIYDAKVMISPKIKDHVLYWRKGNFYDVEYLEETLCDDMPEPDYEKYEGDIDWGDWDSYPSLRIDYCDNPCVYVTQNLVPEVKGSQSNPST